MARSYLTPIDLNKLEIRNAAIQNLGSAPSSPAIGQVYVDTTGGLNRFYYWNGTAFVNKATDSDLLGGSAGSFYLARANHTGTQLAATISDFDTQVRTSRLDQMAAPTGAVALNGQKITGLGTPTLAGDAVTKAYTDAIQTGLDTKASVRAASTATVGTYNNVGGTSALGQLTACPNTLDGVSLAANDRVLIKDHTTGAANGVYVVTTLGSGANGVWDRATDFDSNAEVTSGAYMWVEEGTANDNSGWQLTTNNPIVLGGASGTALVFAQFNGLGQITAGAGLTKTGSTLDVGQSTGIVVNADNIAVDVTVVARKYTTTVGDGAAVAYVITHNLANQFCNCQVFLNSGTFALVDCDIELTSANTLTLRFATAPASAAYRVVVTG